MIGKLFNAVAYLALASLLGAGGFVGYLFAVGQLDRPRVEQLVQVLRGELPAATTQPAEATAGAAGVAAADGGPVRTSDQEAAARREREHLELLELERARADVAARRRLLDQALAELVRTQEQVDADRTEFKQQQEARANALVNEGFQKELRLVAGMKPAQAKEHVLRVWRERPADAVRLLAGLDERQARRVLEQFRSAEELDIQTELLEQIRLQGTQGLAAKSGKTAGAAAP